MTGVGADAHLLVWMYERSARGQGDLVGPEDFPAEWRRARFRLRADLNDLVRKGQLERHFVFRRGTSTACRAPVSWRRSGSCTCGATLKDASNTPATDWYPLPPALPTAPPSGSKHFSVCRSRRYTANP